MSNFDTGYWELEREIVSEEICLEMFFVFQSWYHEYVPSVEVLCTEYFSTWTLFLVLTEVLMILHIVSAL